VQECLDAELIAAGIAHALRQALRTGADLRPALRSDRSRLQETRETARLVGAVGAPDRRPQRAAAERRPILEDVSGHRDHLRER
jgi:hypothetical protein